MDIKNKRSESVSGEKYEKLYALVVKLLARTEEIKNETGELAAFVRGAVKK